MMKNVKVMLVPWKARVYRTYYKARMARKDLSRLHIGCGDRYLEGFTNIDLHSATADIRANVLNMRFFPAGSTELIYSNALFEHVGRPDALRLFLEGCRQVLSEEGIAMHLGIPNFREVARCYLQKEKGIVDLDGGHFGLENAYRYTHGRPETAHSFVAQLHKDLYDSEKVAKLASEVFPWVRVIQYRYPGEPHYLNIGLFVSKQIHSESKVLDLLKSDFVYGVDVETIRFDQLDK